MTGKNEILVEKHAVDSELRGLLSSNDAIYSVLLSSIDGHAIAKQSNEDFAESRLAAMASSCLALGEKIAEEARQNGCDFVIIQNEIGYLALKRIGKKLVIIVLADKTINLGMLLSATRNTAETLEKSMRINTDAD